MISIFNIHKQRDKLKLRRDYLVAKAQGREVAGVEGFAQAKKEMNDACDLFHAQVKTPVHIVKSFLPWTKQYNLRMIAATRLDTFNKKLNTLAYLISIAPCKSSTVLKSVEETRFFKSPIGYNPGLPNKKPITKCQSAPTVFYVFRR